MKQLPLGMSLRGDATFASFAAGSNAELLAALQGPYMGPLWLWGAAGAGKTHLLQALCAWAGPAAAYFPLIRTERLPPEALLGFESCRVLCLDDAGEVAGDPAWEQALFRLFNEAAEAGTRLVFAAPAAPRQFDWSLEDWRSRASACLTYQVRELDDAGRVEALQLRAAQRGLDLPGESAEYLLRRVPRDLKSLYRVLERLDQASLIAQRRLTVPFIREALETPAGIEPSYKTS